LTSDTKAEKQEDCVWLLNLEKEDDCRKAKANIWEWKSSKEKLNKQNKVQDSVLDKVFQQKASKVCMVLDKRAKA
jgi:hypothetical protein